jgi:hypothetical protein
MLSYFILFINNSYRSKTYTFLKEGKILSLVKADSIFELDLTFELIKFKDAHLEKASIENEDQKQ